MLTHLVSSRLQSNTLPAKHANLPTPNSQKTTVSSSSLATPVDLSNPSVVSRSVSKLKQREDPKLVRERALFPEKACTFLPLLSLSVLCKAMKSFDSLSLCHFDISVLDDNL